MTTTIVSNRTSNGSSDPVAITGSASFGSFRNIQAFGTFDGATATLEGRIDDTHWTPIDGGTFTEPIMKTIRLRSCDLRVTVSSAGGSTSVSVITT